MKIFNKFFLLALVICSLTFVKAQKSVQLVGQANSGIKDAPEAENIKGSPFLDDKFSNGKIGNLNKAFRYNIFKDQVEYLENGQVLVLIPSVENSPIVFPDKSVLVQKTFPWKGGSATGYVFQLYEKDNVGVYMKKSKKFMPAVKAVSTLERDMAASYSDGSDTYFIQINNGDLKEISLTKKKFVELFPDKKDEINAIKVSNKLDLQSLKQIVDVVAK